MLLRIARTVADRIAPCYGEIDPHGKHTGVDDQTMLERLLYLNPADTVAQARQRLRGYAWLTICPWEIGDKLGGLDGLTATGAFHQVEQRANGGFWLQATKWYEDYNTGEAHRVFDALQRVLPPGCPAHVYSEEPNLIVPKAQQPWLEDPNRHPAVTVPAHPRYDSWHRCVEGSAADLRSERHNQAWRCSPAFSDERPQRTELTASTWEPLPDGLAPAALRVA